MWSPTRVIFNIEVTKSYDEDGQCYLRVMLRAPCRWRNVSSSLGFAPITLGSLEHPDATQGINHPGFLEVRYIHPAIPVGWTGSRGVTQDFSPLFRQQGLTNDLKGLKVRFWPKTDLSPGSSPGTEPKSPRALPLSLHLEETLLPLPYFIPLKA